MIKTVKQTYGEIAPEKKTRGTNISERMDQPPKITGQAGTEPQNSGNLFLIPAESAAGRRQ